MHNSNVGDTKYTIEKYEKIFNIHLKDITDNVLKEYSFINKLFENRVL